MCKHPPFPHPRSHPGRHKLKHLTPLPFYPPSPQFLGCYNCRFDEMKNVSFSCLLKAKKEYLFCSKFGLHFDGNELFSFFFCYSSFFFF